MIRLEVRQTSIGINGSVNVEFFLTEAQYLILAREFIDRLEAGKSSRDKESDKYLDLELAE